MHASRVRLSLSTLSLAVLTRRSWYHVSVTLASFIHSFMSDVPYIFVYRCQQPSGPHDKTVVQRQGPEQPSAPGTLPQVLCTPRKLQRGGACGARTL